MHFCHGVVWGCIFIQPVVFVGTVVVGVGVRVVEEVLSNTTTPI